MSNVYYGAIKAICTAEQQTFAIAEDNFAPDEEPVDEPVVPQNKTSVLTYKIIWRKK
jgi:hypothetical protein